MLAEIKGVRAEERGDIISQSRDLAIVQDDTILGNSDKMLFLEKELVASIEDPKLTQNPFVLTKLDLTTINDFDFEEYQLNPNRKSSSISTI